MVSAGISSQMAIPSRIEDNGGKFSKSGCGIRDLSVKNHWKTLPKKFRIDKPTILCLGGNGTTTSQKANGNCAIAERLMGLKRNEGITSYNDINIIGFYYGRNKKEDSVGEFSKEELNDFVDQLLLPLCVGDTGDRLPLYEACKNFSLVTFNTHCHGSKEVNNMINLLNKKLLLRGYSSDETKEIFAHSFQMSYAPIQDECCVPSVRFVSMTDSHNFMLRQVYKDCYGSDLNGIAIKYDEPDKFRGRTALFPHYDTISVYSSRLLNNVDYSSQNKLEDAVAGHNSNIKKVTDEHTIIYVDRDDDWNLTKDSLDAPNAEVMSTLMGYTIAWAMGKSVSTFINGNLEFPKISKENKEAGIYCLNQLNSDLNNILESYKDQDLTYIK